MKPSTSTKLVVLLLLSSSVLEAEEPIVISCISDDVMLRALDRTKYWTIDQDNNTITIDNGVELVITSLDDNFISAERKDDPQFHVKLDRRTLKMTSTYLGDSYNYSFEIAPTPKL